MNPISLRQRHGFTFVLTLLLCLPLLAQASEAPLPSWNEGPAKNNIIESDDYAKTWLTQARHPKTGKPYSEMIFQPMLEMLDYLRSQDFKTYIVSGEDTGFMRAVAEKIYGIPPGQVIGTTFATTFQYTDGEHYI